MRTPNMLRSRLDLKLKVSSSKPKPLSSLDQKHARLRKLTIEWFRDNGRRFPWRETKDVFHIFIAEILLRQTQATRLTKPYQELIEKYPDIDSLAKAQVAHLREWFKPLGLVTRADRLIKAANILSARYGGKIPEDLKNLIELPGLGIYSARAILCLGFNKSYPMIDEGSGRVLQRVLKIDIEGPSYSNPKLLQSAEEILPKHSFREFNLGLIDIAAIFCHVKNPVCPLCPLLSVCCYGQTRTELGKWKVSQSP
jgi:A/G-specific adenine glycosylase